MPGFCGAFGFGTEEYDYLWREFSQPWADCEFKDFRGGFLGGHAFGSASAIYTPDEHSLIAVDGESAIYSSMSKREKGVGRSSSLTGPLDLSENCKGNIGYVDLHSHECHLEAEQTGTFPLYYTLTKSGQLLCSSRLRPLARATNASHDLVGISEFLTKRHTFYRRTCYQNIFRLLPGQAVTYHFDTRQLTVREPRITWVEKKAMDPSSVDYEVLWEEVRNVGKRCFDSEKRHALMMSGGWDSRLLLCAMLEELGSQNVVAYTWGDKRSRELQVVTQICRSVGVECIMEPLDHTLYDPSFLEKSFDRIENVLFPQWCRAGEQLSRMGVRSVSAGVYGEVLGGHYGPAMVLTGMRKVLAVGAALMGVPVYFNSFERLRFPEVPRKPWFVKKTAWDSMRDATLEMNGDIESVWQDLEKLGIENRDQLMESYVALTRGSRYINQQILSCRTALDITIPFTDLGLLKLANQIPHYAKIHNTINKRLLERHGSSLLQFTTGATLVPASMPICFQEASRVLRSLHDNVFGKLNRFTGGGIRPPRSDFFGLDFLRDGKALSKLREDLRSDIWDQDAIAQSIKNIIEHKEATTTNLVNISSNFLTIFTADLMLRGKA